ncbi:MAG: sn-glycerol-3-phosphate ABC transporter substrate-binding protein [Burkholderiales bacterium RIFCSPHIGHO2_12_FULL_69_20]|nr:MAG: sn-glycerol-3-phosphate ABC transporter substrate-binding protein [Burkholderiales bacterium RIFCSPHIGHO2_12_FULL_69_20]
MKLKLHAAALAAATLLALPAQAQTEIQWWHSMTGALGDRVTEMATGFNASQKDYKVVPVYKGSYPESMTAAIAAFRAGNAPHIVQVFEVGTATMMSARGAIKPVYQLMKDSGQPFDPKSYVSAVAGYYTDSKGNMLSMPFNSSTPVFYINKDAFKKAGLDPNAVPKTWKDFGIAAGKLKASGQSCVYTTGWPSWVHVENFSAWHNLPIGTKENGIGGIDTQFTINSPLHVAHIQMLGDFAKNGWFTYAGRRNEAEAKFFSGECAMLTSSSAAQANIRKNAKFEFSVNFLPYNDTIKGAPQNSIIGGASLWVLAGKKAVDYKGVAQFFNYIARPELQASWHQGTGYVPLTNAAAELTRKTGYYEKNPGTDVAVKQLNNKAPTANSKGLRFGNFVQGREVIEEEIESVLAGKKDAKTAMDEAVRRGNEILRKFAAANKE